MQNLAVATSVRPARVAVLVDIHDKNWQHTCTRILEYFSRLWGGFGNVIIPTDGQTIAPLFWRLLDLFDPDFIQCYRRTGADIAFEDPARFEELYGANIAAWEKQIGTKTDQHAAKSIRQGLRSAIETPFEISPKLQQQLKDRLSPFYFEKWIIEPGSLGAESIPRHPLTDVVDVLHDINHGTTVLDVAATDSLSALWWASIIGKASPAFCDELAKRGVDVVKLTPGEDAYHRLFDVAIQGYESVRPRGFLTGGSADNNRELLESLPARYSLVGLSTYRSIKAHDWAEPAVAIVGNSVEDFALYQVLSRLRPRVVWLLPSITSDALRSPEKKAEINEEYYFAHAVNRISSRDSQRISGLRATSVTLSPEEVTAITERLSTVALMQTEKAIFSKPCDCIPIYPTRIFETNNGVRVRSVPVTDEHLIPLFETPLPKQFRNVDPGKLRWLTELRVVKHHAPRHYSLGWWMMGSSAITTHEVRISAEGPTYFSPSVLIMGGNDAESSTYRPSIRIPSAVDIFEVATSDKNLRCKISDKGFYAENACQKFGGLKELARFLRSSEGQSLTAFFLNKAKPEDGEHTSGVLLGNRRYLDVESVKVRLSNCSDPVGILDRLSSLGVLYRGLILQCEFCRRAEWFPLVEISDSFLCKRCHRSQVFTRKHWRNPDEPHLYYQLDELVYLGLEHNMHVPVLTLDYLGTHAQDSFLHTPELEYSDKTSSDKILESDINCIVDGVLTIGEAKKENRLSDSEKGELTIIHKYANLAREICAREVVFSTASSEWSLKTLDNIHCVFKDDYINLKFLARSDLYGSLA